MLEALQNSVITLTLLNMELYRIQFTEDLKRVPENKENIIETCRVRRLCMSVEIKCISLGPELTLAFSSFIFGSWFSSNPHG